MLCKASSLCAFRKSSLRQQAGGWGWYPWWDALPGPQQHPQGYGSMCVCSVLLCIPHPCISRQSLNHLVTVILGRDHILLPDPFLHRDVVPCCNDDASFATEGFSHIFQTDRLFTHQSCPLGWLQGGRGIALAMCFAGSGLLLRSSVHNLLHL